MTDLRCTRKTNTQRKIVQSSNTYGLMISVLKDVRQGDQNDWSGKSSKDMSELVNLRGRTIYKPYVNKQ